MPPVSLGSEKHLPGFVALSDELKAAGAEVIACVSGVAAHVRVCRQ
jgi:peroxiredoxin